MSNKYFIEYEALVYNLPECNNFEFLGHSFVPHIITDDMQNDIILDNDILRSNFTFASCIVSYSDGHSSYITAQNKETIEMTCENNSEKELYEKTLDIVCKKINEIEQHLIFTTNMHIFFPVVKITVYTDNRSERHIYGHYNYRPMPYQKWSWLKENINLERRLNFGIDKKCFDEFRFHKKHTRYARAFDYYIKSFYELNHSIAFCLQCAAIDAITGKNGSGETKKRLARYSSVLFCQPLRTEELKNKMEVFYKKRSRFVHGKGDDITVEDELELREYVRKFLISYYLFWITMDIKTEEQMLQKLDEIYQNPSLNVKYAVAAYSFISINDEYEKGQEDIFAMSMSQKLDLAHRKIREAFIAISPQEQDE